jgi:hypothetical protein
MTAEDMTTLRRVMPAIVVQVVFVEWTQDGLSSVHSHEKQPAQ